MPIECMIGKEFDRDYETLLEYGMNSIDISKLLNEPDFAFEEAARKIREGDIGDEV